MTDEDEAFYTDNCMESHKATCSATVSTSWMKKKKREQSRNESAEKRRVEMKESERQETCAKKSQFQEALKPISDSWSMDSDSDFEAPSCSIHSPLPVNTRSTPLNNIPDQLNPQTEQPEQTVFPGVKVRNSRFKINEQTVRCTVQCLAGYKVSPNDLTGIIVNTVNIIFDQNWEKEDDVAAEEDEYEHIQSDTTEESDDDEPQPEENSSTSKRRMSKKDLTYVFPSRRTINRYLEDALYLNMVAE